MSPPTINMITRMVADFVLEAPDDWIGLWEIIKELMADGIDQAELLPATLSVVQVMLARGFLAGDPPYSAGGFQLWASQDHDAIIERIRSEWLVLGRVPNIPDIVWFDQPDAASSSG